jgi:peptide/nickel transport system substrate-binding protein
MTRRRVAKGVGALVLVLAFVLAVGVGTLSASPKAPKATPTTTLNVRLPLDYPSLDPMVDAVNSIGWAAVKPGYDYLVAIRANGKGFEPYLATSWKQTPKSITFKVRRDATCTDGHKLTPVDMLNSIKRFIFVQKRGGSPANTSAGGLGPGPYHLRASNKQGTLTVTLEKPWRNLMGIFSGLPMICPAGLKALESDPRALENRVYGSGPYTLVSAQHNNQVSYRLRKAWKWGPRGTSTATMADNLNFKVVIDPTTAANLLITGGLDISTMAGPDVKRLLSMRSLGYTKAVNWVVAGLMFNMRPGKLFENGEGDKLREAIYTAVDPRSFNTAVYEGRGTLSKTVFRPDMECYDKAAEKLAPAPSLARARQILSNAGYTVVNGRLSKGGRPVPKITLLSSASFFPNGGAYVLSVLTQLGLDIELDDLGATYGPAAIGGNFDIFISFANRPSLEPGNQMNSLQGTPSPAGSNIGGVGFGDPLWTRYYNAALQNVGPGSCRYFALVQKMAIQKHYYVPLVSPPYDVFYRKSAVKGTFPTWPPDAFGFPWFRVKTK